MGLLRAAPGTDGKLLEAGTLEIEGRTRGRELEEVAFTADGRSLLAADGTGGWIVWSPAPETRLARGGPTFGGVLGRSPRGLWLRRPSRRRGLRAGHGEVGLLDGQGETNWTGPYRLPRGPERLDGHDLTVLPDGRRILTRWTGGFASVHPLESAPGRPPPDLLLLARPPGDAAGSDLLPSGGGRWAVETREGSEVVRLWDLEAGTRVTSRPPAGRLLRWIEDPELYRPQLTCPETDRPVWRDGSAIGGWISGDEPDAAPDGLLHLDRGGSHEARLLTGGRWVVEHQRDHLVAWDLSVHSRFPRNSIPLAGAAEVGAGRTMAASPGGDWIAIAHGDEVVVWEVHLGEEITARRAHTVSADRRSPGPLAIGPGGRWVLAGRRLLGIDPNRGETRWTYRLGERGRGIARFEMDEEGRVLLLDGGGADGRLRIFTLRPDRPPDGPGLTLDPGPGRVRSMDACPDGRLLAAGLQRGVARVWTLSPDRTRADPLATLHVPVPPGTPNPGRRSSPPGQVDGVAFEPDAPVLWTAVRRVGLARWELPIRGRNLTVDGERVRWEADPDPPAEPPPLEAACRWNDGGPGDDEEDPLRLQLTVRNPRAEAAHLVRADLVREGGDGVRSRPVVLGTLLPDEEARRSVTAPGDAGLGVRARISLHLVDQASPVPTTIPVPLPPGEALGPAGAGDAPAEPPAEPGPVRESPVDLTVSGDLAVTLRAGRLGVHRLSTAGAGSSELVVETVPGARVSAATLSPDGERILAGTPAGTFRLHAPREDGSSLLASFGGDREAVSAVALLRERGWAIGGHEDGSVRLWHVDLDDGTAAEAATLDHDAAVRALAASRDGRRLLVGTADGAARLWRLDLSGRGEARPAADLPAGESPLREVALAPDGRWALTGAEDGTVRLWRLPDDGPPHPVDRMVHDAPAGTVGFGPGGRTILTGSVREARLWSLDRAAEGLSEGSPIPKTHHGPWSFTFRDGFVWTSTLLPDGSVLQEALSLPDFGVHPPSVTFAANLRGGRLGSDGRWLFLGTTAWTVEPRRRRISWRVGVGMHYHPLDLGVWSREGTWLLQWGRRASRGILHHLDREGTARLARVREIPDLGDWVRSQAGEHPGRWDLTRGLRDRDFARRVWQLLTDVAGWEYPRRGPYAVAVAPDLTWALTGDGEGLHLWRPDPEGEEPPELRASSASPPEPLTELDATPDGRLALSDGGGDGEGEAAAIVWRIDPRAGTVERADTLPGHEHSITALRLSDDGRTALIGGLGRTVRRWSLDPGTGEATLDAILPVPEAFDGGGLRSLDRTPDGRWILATAGALTVSLWNLDSDRARPPPLFDVRWSAGRPARRPGDPDPRRVARSSPPRVPWADGLASRVEARKIPPVEWTELSSDGTRAVGRTPGGRIVHVRMGRGEPRSVELVPSSPLDPVAAAGWSADGHWLLTSHRARRQREPGEVVLWRIGEDGLSAEEVGRFRPPEGRVADVALSPGAWWAATRLTRGSTVVWRLRPGESPLAEPRVSVGLGRRRRAGRFRRLRGGMGFLPDGLHLVTAGGSVEEEDDEVRVWRIDPSDPVVCRQVARRTASGRVHVLRIRDDEIDLSGGRRLRHRRWRFEPDTGSLVETLELSGSASPGLALDRERGLLVIGRHREPRLADLRRTGGSPLALELVEPGHDSLVSCRLATFDADGLLRTLDEAGRLQAWRIDLSAQEAVELAGTRELGGRAEALVWPEGGPLAADRAPSVRRLPDGPVRETGARVIALATSADGRRLLEGRVDGTAVLRSLAPDDPSTSGLPARLEGHGGAVTAGAFLPGNRVATGARDGFLRIWAVDPAGEEPARVVARADLPAGWATSLAVSPSGDRLLAGSADGTARLWDLPPAGEAMEPLAILRGHRAVVRDVAFGPDGRWVITASDDGVPRVWDLAPLEEGDEVEATLRLPPVPSGDRDDDTWTVAFSPDGRRLLTAGASSRVRLWSFDPGTGETRLRAVLDGHEGAVTDVAFSPDGREAVSCSWDGTARRWRLPETR